MSESGTMTGGGAKPKGGRMCVGTAAPRAQDSKEAAAELKKVEQELATASQVHASASGMPTQSHKPV